MKHIIMLRVTDPQDQISPVLCLKISFEWKQHEEYFSYLLALPLTATKDANMALLFFPILSSVKEISHLVSTFACWILCCGIHSGYITSMHLWIPVCLEKTQTKHLLNLQLCWISALYWIFLNWHINIYV